MRLEAMLVDAAISKAAAYDQQEYADAILAEVTVIEQLMGELCRQYNRLQFPKEFGWSDLRELAAKARRPQKENENDHFSSSIQE